MMILHWPWLLALLPLPWFIRRFMAGNIQQEPALYFPALIALQRVQNTSISHQTTVQPFSKRLVCLWIIWCLLVLSAARPQWQGEPIGLPMSGRDLLLAVDISGSMETPDMKLDDKPVQRIDAIKKVVADFVLQRTGDRLGLVLFGSRAYLQTPLTFDRTTMAKQLEEARLGFAGEKTSIGDALALSVKRLQDRNQKSRVIILLTDGANTAGEITPMQGAELAANLGIRVYTVGIGADAMEVRSFFSRQTINPSADLDEDTLTKIAQKTGGQYFRARSTEALQGIYAELDRLEPSLGDEAFLRPVTEYFYWPLSLAVLINALLTLQMLWSNYGSRIHQKGEM